MKKVVDARGLSCPQPVILTKKALEESDQVTTIVDNRTAVENVTRLATRKGFSVEVEKKEGEYHLLICKSSCAVETSAEEQEKVVVLVTSNLFGQGEEELGKTLMRSFLYTLTQMENIKQMIFMNSGVFLTTEGSEVLEMLKTMEESGVEILSCGTCLDYYGLKDKLAVGKVTNMYTAVEAITSAARLITL
ncbi:MAG: sulfurtransferase-like selenium metabolism protein YedF [Thermacetogeniaceae bacterium]|jgi:selenium metabolism protein YedF|nr:sulfurtransferase-like selenium metabolism protein YedF [Syntrophomonadaceae bacterium]